VAKETPAREMARSSPVKIRSLIWERSKLATGKVFRRVRLLEKGTVGSFGIFERVTMQVGKFEERNSRKRNLKVERGLTLSLSAMLTRNLLVLSKYRG
jgi:hypothetical protein